jgi:signal transduction histidine kinase
MSVHPTLLVRRWPERRPVVLTAGALGFVAVLVAGGPADAGLGALYILPVLLVALELGLLGGGIAAVGAAAVSLASGALPAAVAALVAGAIAGRFSDRMRAVHVREQRLVESGLALGEPDAQRRLPRTIAAAAMNMPRVAGVEVQLDGAATVAMGRIEGPRSVSDIVARGVVLGHIVAHHRRPAHEDRAAIELLAVQGALAADNQRLLAQERQAALLEAELRQMRDDLLEQRSGLGRLLAAQEHDRQRVADTLHEELAQVLAAVLLGLRMVRRRGSFDDAALDELHGQVVGVLEDIRQLAGALRPAPLAHLGLVPALEALQDDFRGLSVEAGGLPEPLPEPLRTGLYRLVESALRAARPGSPADVELRAAGRRLDLVVDVDLVDAAEPLAAARARAALLKGTLRPERLPDGRTRLRARLPVAGGELLTARAQ